MGQSAPCPRETVTQKRLVPLMSSHISRILEILHQVQKMCISQHMGVSPSGDDFISQGYAAYPAEDAASSPNFGICDSTPRFRKLFFWVLFK